ncbi:MAG: hypothetical protein JXR73_05100 [Candidatus Omnitrophica bacterium]|nr:hypothetical protein [Candidatus Omnitrophota bacterium]
MNPDTNLFIQHLQSQRKFEAVESLAMGSEHIGAILAEAVLLPGSRYKSQVRPRIERLLKEYPEGKTSGVFVCMIEEISPKYFFNWDENDKPRRVLAAAKYLHELGVESTDDFRLLFDEPDFAKSLKEIRGIGAKHIDDLRQLLRLPCDSREEAMRIILEEAGFNFQTLDEASSMLEEVSSILDLAHEHLLLCIWRYVNYR